MSFNFLKIEHFQSIEKVMFVFSSQKQQIWLKYKAVRRLSLLFFSTWFTLQLQLLVD